MTRAKTIGVIGGGQLGRMFALDAKRMGYDVITLDPQPRSPCGQVADEQIVAQYDDMQAIDELGRRTDVVTYEFENIAIASVERLEAGGYAVTPSSSVLRITQDRLLEKQFAQRCGIPVAPFAAVQSTADLKQAAQSVGFPAILKTTRGGYDGKGQWRISCAADAQAALSAAAGAPLIWERMIDFTSEISVVATRSAQDDVIYFPAAENVHDEGILVQSIAPARVAQEAARKAQEYTIRVARELKITGTFCVEYFVASDGTVILNEIAPRPHNSGHYTIDVTTCSQYEQHVRAICNLPVLPPRLLSSAVMINILGSGTGNELYGIERLLSDPAIVLHMYGKRHAVRRRKMGHFTMLVDGPVRDADVERAHCALALLHWGDASADC